MEAKKTRIRYKPHERDQILAAAATSVIRDDYEYQSLTAYFKAAMRAALTPDRWREIAGTLVDNAPAFAWFRDGIAAMKRTPITALPETPIPLPPPTPRLIAVFKPALEPLVQETKDIGGFTNEELIIELFTRFDLKLSKLAAGMARLEAQVASLAPKAPGAEVVVPEQITIPEPIPADDATTLIQPSVIPPTPIQPSIIPPAPIQPSIIPKPKPKLVLVQPVQHRVKHKLKIKVVGPKGDQQRFIAERVGDAAELSFIDSSAITCLSDFNNIDRAVITRHQGHQAWYQAKSVLGRDNVIRLSSSGIGTVVETILKFTRQ